VTVEGEAERLRQRLERERRKRADAELIAEQATTSLYETVQRLERSTAELDEASGLIGVMQRVAVAANEATVLEEAAQVALGEVCRYSSWPVGHLYVSDEPGRLIPTGVWYLDQPERCEVFRHITEKTVLCSGEGLPGRVLASGRPAWIEDIRTDLNFPRARMATDIGVQAGCAFPVVVGTEVVAVLEFFSTEPAVPNVALLDVMASMGTQLGRVVERARAAQALREGEERNRLIIETANDAFVAIDASGRIVDWNHQAELHFGWTRDEALGCLLTETIIPPSQRQDHLRGIARFLDTGEGPLLGRRVELEGAHKDGHQFPIELIPWVVRDGDGYRFNAFIHDITERKALSRQLEHQSLHDALTGLPNRALLMDRLRHALAACRRDSAKLAMLFIDLDRFKPVNDSLGHEAGDRVLIGVTDRILGVLRAEDTLARLGGDEFVVLCPNLLGASDAIRVSERVIASLAHPFVVSGTEVYISASIGIVETSGERVRAEQLLSDADLAMYRAKERGRGVYELFDQSMRARLVERLTVEKELRTSIEKDQLCLHYQPVFDMAGGHVAGVEALVRWNHPERGLLPPSAFIPLAEDTGIIGGIGSWVIEETCRQLRAWKDERGEHSPFWASINLSVREVEQHRFIERLMATLRDHSISPEELVLEITESVVMHDTKAVIRRLWELRECGVRLAIDDFGTGYSSLDRLRRMPVDILKIDKSFVSELDSSAAGASLAGAIVAMSHSLGLRVVAEGVETPRQLQILHELGCDAVQGYLISRPLPAEELGPVLSARPDGCSNRPCEWPDSLSELHPDLTRVVARALTDTDKIERTTRSLLAELRRLVDLELAVAARTPDAHPPPVMSDG
jgi:diguanylate cyclase (GGDEF)-like protein/PAS domain S-box-containing protein